MEDLTPKLGYQAVPVLVLLVHGSVEQMGDWRKRAREVFGGLRHRPLVLMYDEQAWTDLSAAEFHNAIAHQKR